MAGSRPTAEDAERAYVLFRHEPNSGVSSYLHHHYKRGLAGVMEPSRDAILAHAAWRAGRDTRRALDGEKR